MPESGVLILSFVFGVTIIFDDDENGDEEVDIAQGLVFCAAQDKLRSAIAVNEDKWVSIRTGRHSVAK
eukprot:gene1835-biopygen3889